MKHYFAQLVSFVLHPFFIPLYSFAFLLFMPFWFSLFINLKVKFLVLAIVFSFTTVFPIINIVFFKYLKVIDDIHLKSSKERVFPFLVILLFYSALVYVFTEFQLLMIYRFTVLGAAIAILLVLIINFFTKISAHLAAFGGLIGIVLELSWYAQINFLPLICLLFFLAGLLAWSRLQLGAHTPMQVYLGFFVGCMSMVLTLGFYHKFG